MIVSARGTVMIDGSATFCGRQPASARTIRPVRKSGRFPRGLEGISGGNRVREEADVFSSASCCPVRVPPEVSVSSGARVEEVRMVCVAAASRDGRRVIKALRTTQQAPVKDARRKRSGPGSASLDRPNDNVPVASDGAEDPAEPVHQVKQSGDVVWDEEQSEALRQARKDAELTASVDSVRAYLRQIGKVALLNAEEEVQLAKRIEAGLYAAEQVRRAEDSTAKLSPQLRRDLRWIVNDGHRAKNRLVEANLRLVVSLAKRYTGRGMPLLDLIQEGNLGLIRAVEKFDYAKGYKFSTYAIWWIRQGITRAMADQARTIRIPVHMDVVINELGCIRRKLLDDLDREPTPEELATQMDTTPGKVREFQHYAREPLSLDQIIGEEGDSPLGDFIEDSQAVVAADVVCFALLQDQLQSVLATLSERDASIIRLRFGLTDGHPRTLDDIGRVYGLTREQIRQIASKTMTKLRHPTRSHALHDYLD